MTDDYGPQIDAYLARRGDEATGRARTALTLASGQNADQSAEAARIGGVLGVPVDVAQRNPEELRKIAYERQVDSFLAKRPQLGDWMTENAPIVHDDLDNVGAVGQAFDLVKGLGQGAVGDFAGGTLRGMGELNAATGRLISRGIRAAGGTAVADALQAPVLPWWLTPGEILSRPGQMAVDAGEAIGPGRDTAGAQLGRGLGQVGGQIGLAVATGGVGSALSWGSMAGQGADQMAEFAERKGAEGTIGGDIGTLAGAAITGATERWGVGQLLEALPPTIKGTFARYLANVGVRAASEGTQEMAEQFGQNAAAKALFAPDQDLAEGVGDSGKIGAGVGGLVGMIAGVTPRHRRIIEADADALDANDRAKALKQAMDAVGNSKLTARDPAKAAELISRLAGENDTVYVPARELAALFQDGTIPPEDAQRLAAEWGVGDQLEQALISGGDLAIETGRFMTSAVARANAEKIVPHVRLVAGEMTAAEAKAWTDGDRQRAIDEATERAAIQSEGNDTTQAVYDRTYEMLTNAGATPEVARQQATLWQERYRTRAAALGGDPLALFNEDNPAIEGPNADLARQVAARDDLTLVIDRLKSGRTNEDATAKYPILSLLKTKGGVRLGTPLAGELGAMGITRKTFPGLFAEGRGVGDVDNLVAAEHPALADNLQGDANGYADRQAVLDAILGEWTGNPLRTHDEQARASRLDEPVAQLREVLRAEGLDPDTATDVEIRDALKQFEHEAGGMVLSQEAFAKDAAHWQKRVAAVRSGSAPGGQLIRLGRTYPVLRALGFPKANLVMLAGKIRKAMAEHPEVSAETWNDLPNLVADPVFIFPSGKGDGSFVVVVNVKGTDGKPIIVPILADSRNQAGDRMNVVLSVYGKGSGVDGVDGAKWIADRWAEAARRGDVVYSRNGNDPADLITQRSNSEGQASQGRQQHEASGQRGRTKKILSRSDVIKAHGDVFYQPDGSMGVRGAFLRALDPYGHPANLIRLTERADLSTFLHESGHFWMFQMIDDAFDPRANPEARAQLQADLQTALDFIGADIKVSESGSDAIHAALTREQHETWARGFEAYLMEGKAPSAALRDAFARFKAWLLNTYRSLRGLHVDLTPEVRGVFDRLLAADGAIAEAENAERYAVADAVRAVLTPAETAALERLSGRATEEAKTALERQILGEMKRAETATWKAERAKVEEGVDAEVRRRPVYAALALLMHGRRPDGSEASRVKLDRAALVEEFGEEVLARLPGPKNGKRQAWGPHIYSREGGVSHHLLASQFGYSSGDEFVRALISAEDMYAVIRRETDAVMKERHGDILTDGSLERKALEAIHDDARGEFLAAELAALARVGGKRVKQPAPAAVLRDAAKRAIGKMKAREAAKSGRFRQQERRAARDYEKALVARDTAAAVEAKQRQLMAFYLQRESLKAASDVDRITADVRKFSQKATRQAIGKAGADYLERIDDILDQYEFRGVAPGRLDRRAALRQWLAAKEAAGEVLPEIPQAVLDDAAMVNYRDLPMETLRGVHDALMSIAHVARFKNKLLRAREKKTLDEAAAEGAGVIAANVAPRKFVANPSRDDVLMRAQRYAQNYFALLTKARTWIETMDGFKRGGWWDRHLLEPIRNAEVARFWRLKAEGEAFAELAAKHYGKGRGLERLTGENTAVFIPSIGVSLRLDERLAIALNWGNEDNRAALVNDRQRRWGEADYRAILATLKARDWAFVQDTWDYLDRFWPEIAALEKTRKGIAPPKVEASAFTVQTADGKTLEIGGGYYPLKYDAEMSVRTSENDIDEQFKSMATGRFGSANTRHGHTKERVGSGGQSVKLSLGVIEQHVDQVVTDLAMWPAVHDAWKLLNHPEVKTAIAQHLGLDAVRGLDMWLKDTAVGQVQAFESPSRMLRGLRSSLSLGAMGLKVSTSLVQVTGFTQTAVELGKRWAWQGFSTFVRNPAEATRTVHALSDFMRTRAETQQRDIRDTLARFKGDGLRDRAVQVMFWPIVKMQQQVDVPTWLGAYNKALAAGEAEERAVKIADSFVEASQGSGLMSSLSAFERGTWSPNVRLSETVKLWTTFYSYFNTKLNVAMRKTTGTDFKNPAAVASLAADYLMLFWVETLLGEALLGLPGMLFGDDDGAGDDDKDWTDYVAHGLWSGVSTMMGALPFAREIASTIQGFDAAPGPARSLGAVGDALKSVARTARDAADPNRDVNLLSFVKYMVAGGNVVSPVKIPAGQINVAISAMERASKGEDVPLVDYLIRSQH
jgi:hypothetical protein